MLVKESFTSLVLILKRIAKLGEAYLAEDTTGNWLQVRSTSRSAEVDRAKEISIY